MLGLTLSLYLTLDVRLEPSDSEKAPPKITCSGEGASEAPLDPYKNLITRVALYVLRCHDVLYFPCQLHIHVDNRIPFGRGLGSSGAAVIAGVLLADAVGQLNLSTERRLDFALMVERHPDNVAAALLGGFVGSYLRELSPEDTSATQIPLAEVLPEYPPNAGADWGMNPPSPPKGIGHFVQFGWAKEIKAVTVIPKFELSTAKARGALQSSYSLKDCVSLAHPDCHTAFDNGFTGVQPPKTGGPDHRSYKVTARLRPHLPSHARPVTSTLQKTFGEPEPWTGAGTLLTGLQIPALPELLSSMSPSTHPGLLGICLSGAGPTILALATENFEAIGKAITSFWLQAGGVECDWKLLDITTTGAEVQVDPSSG